MGDVTGEAFCRSLGAGANRTEGRGHKDEILPVIHGAKPTALHQSAANWTALQ